VFGLPGDFVLPLFRALEEEPGIEPVILTHEPAVGYAADAYARVQGLGVAVVTYGAGAGGQGRNPDRCDHSSRYLLGFDAALWRRRS
jgi:glyoxylate carboligase